MDIFSFASFINPLNKHSFIISPTEKSMFDVLLL